MSVNMTTRQSLSSSTAVCPSCERFIGPVGMCPYCGSDSARPRSLKILQTAAVVLAGVGLLFLYVMARYREVPLVQIGDITPLMNYATVRVAGTVDRKPYVSKRKGKVDYVSFLVDDGTGALRVSADREVARMLVARDLLPQRGQRVDVTGRLSVTADGRQKLRIQSAGQVKGERSEGRSF